MSLLFERAVRAFSPADAELVRATPDGDGRDDARDSVAFDADYLARLVSTRRRELVPSERVDDGGDGDGRDSADGRDRLRVPLHGPETAELSGEYVAFERHPVRGDILVYRDAETGADEPLALDAAAGTDLGRRLRFWLPGDAPDERPSYAREGPSSSVSPANPIPPGDREDYFDRLAEFVADEREAERRRNRERARRHSPRELAERGETAIPELTGFSALADGGIECFVNEGSGVDVRDRYGVYEDDEVLLHAPPDADPGDALVAFPLELTVKRLTDRTLDLVPRESTPNLDAAADFLEGADGVGLSLLLNPTVHDREEAAIRSVRDDDDRRATVTGAADASFAAERAVETERRDDHLDEAQSLAAAAGLYAEDVCCIHGPPGTGKTRVLVEIVRRAVAAGDRVLVCADSNQGVDNAVAGESTRDHLDESSLHYYATVEEEFELDRHHEYHSDRPLVREAYDGDPRKPDVVATTNNSAADYPDGAFDLAVVDEATQATTASGLIPFSKADSVVLAGDHRQLPPYEATDDPPTDEWDRSLFEHFYADDGVYGSSVGVFLSTQYRMHEDIAAFPSRAFYGGTLWNGADVPPVDDLPPAVGLDASGSEREDANGSYANPAEATAVGRLVERLLDAGVDAGDVGVITPYRAQRRAVRDELGELSAPTDAVTVDTVDSFQGGEREAIVVSFVRSNARGDVGFLGREQDGPRRLNVALTRAERFCGLVGDWDTLRDGDDGRNACADLYRDLYEQLASADRMGLDEYA